LPAAEGTAKAHCHGFLVFRDQPENEHPIGWKGFVPMNVSGQGCSANFRRYANQRIAAAWRRCTELDLRGTK